MSAANTLTITPLARTLTLATYTSFVPIGIATVLLGPMLPILSVRWSMNYAQAGALFTAQYIASTCAVAVSGWLASRWGYRFAIKAGLILMSSGLALLMVGPKWMGILCIAASGAGLGLAVPAANLLVADANPGRRSATLNLLNFFWSVGAVACPFLIAAAARNHAIPLFLGAVSGVSLVIAAGIALMPVDVAEPSASGKSEPEILPLVRTKSLSFTVLAALFFLYVGMENGFGGWIASYSKSLGKLTPTVAVMTPSVFYAAMTFGRWLAPLLLRAAGEIKLVQGGLLLSCAGMAGLVFSSGLPGVLASACSAGLGLSYVYPITISLLSKEFASARIGSVMFVLSNIGGGLLPWIVGVSSTRFGTLKAGLLIPLLACSLMFLLYLGPWTRAMVEQPSE